MPEDPFPSDFVPKTQPSHHVDQRLFGHNKEFPYIQVKFRRSTWFINHPREEFLSPEQTLLLNSMEQDKYLLGRTPGDELYRLLLLEDVVDAYFPGDRWTYEEEMTNREVLQEIERSVEGQIELKRMADTIGLDVALYPIITGWRPHHYEHSRELFKVFDTRSCAFDATQYNSIHNLVTDLENLRDVLSPDRIYLNGRVAPNHLKKLPREVVAFSGNLTTRDEVKLPNGELSQSLLHEAVDKRIEALHSIQSELSEFIHEQITG